jgi:hypothetical protein
MALYKKLLIDLSGTRLQFIYARRMEANWDVFNISERVASGPQVDQVVFLVIEDFIYDFD